MITTINAIVVVILIIIIIIYHHYPSHYRYHDILFIHHSCFLESWERNSIWKSKRSCLSVQSWSEKVGHIQLASCVYKKCDSVPLAVLLKFTCHLCHLCKRIIVCRQTTTNNNVLSHQMYMSAWLLIQSQGTAGHNTRRVAVPIWGEEIWPRRIQCLIVSSQPKTSAMPDQWQRQRSRIGGIITLESDNIFHLYHHSSFSLDILVKGSLDEKLPSYEVLKMLRE